MSAAVQFENTFELIDSCLGRGQPIPNGWTPIQQQPLLIFVGGMGVGKTTTIVHLLDHDIPIQLLPNRRDLTVKLIVAPQQRAEGKPVRYLHRLDRIPYIKRYQEQFPGGLAHAFSQLSVAPAPCEGPLVFDGLRGAREIQYAVEHFPMAYYLMLTTSNFVRIQRLLQRHDPYDRIGFDPPKFESLKELYDFLSIGIPDNNGIFSAKEEQALLDMVQSGEIKLSSLADKLSLIWAERGMYNLDETKKTIEQWAPQRSLIVDTTEIPPEEVFCEVTKFMEICINQA